MDNFNLYEITSGFSALMENEEITEEDKKKIEEELTVLLQQKSQNIIGYTRNIELTINAMKEEEKRIAEDRKALENKMARFKDYVKECMERNGITKIETGLGTLSIAKSPVSVEIVNEDEVPSEFKQEVVTAFSGLLELSRRSKVETKQEELFGDIEVEKSKKVG